MHFTVFAVLLMSLAEISQPELLDHEVRDILYRDVVVADFPQQNTTYLTYDPLHGFQVAYYGREGENWLWYPGSDVALEGEYRRVTLRDHTVLCLRYDMKARSPVTRRGGGKFNCQALDLEEKIAIAERPGDVFDLASGAVPYRKTFCDPTEHFDFDERAYRCLR